MPTPNRHILLLCLFSFALHCYAQQPAYTFYTVRDGIASNDTYNCIEDKKGFLWIATENGVSRFDGVNFKNYYIANGLLDNDVVLLEMDSNGTIWALPFQQTPAYYDYNTDKFINSNTDASLKKITTSNVANANALANGEMAFCNSNGVVHIVNKKIYTTYLIGYNKIINRVICLPNRKYLAVCTDSIINLSAKKAYVYSQNKKSKRTAFINNQLYVADSNTLFKISINDDGSIGKTIKNVLPFVMVNLNFTGKQLAVASGTGNIYFADTTTLQFSAIGLSFNALIRHVFEDKAGNTWICTRESGLIRYQQKGILTIKEKEFNRNFNALCFWKNKLVAGTNQGQFIIYDAPYTSQTISLNNEVNFTTWIRQLSVYKNKLFIVAEGGLFNYETNLSQNVIYNRNGNIANKAFIFLNDSTAIAGNSSGLRKINYTTLKTEAKVQIRVTALEKTDEESIYVGSNNGLYKWHKCTTLKPLPLTYALTKRVNTLAYNKEDNILWVGLAYDTIIALQNDIIIAKIPLNNILPGNECRKIFSTEKGIAWVGTNAILSKIDYQTINKNFTYKVTTFSMVDGIAGKQINDIALHKDTVYVATNAGISFLPQSLQFKITDAPIYISSVKISNVDTILQGSYTLPYTTKNITLNFTSPNLGSSALRIYEYQINKGSWLKTTESKIDLLQLTPKTYNINIRPYNSDGTLSKNMATIQFKIKAPFWETNLFLFLFTLVSIALLIYFLQRRNKIKREKTIQQLLTEKKLTDLELKALKAQINPHFVFNCLNSIKFLNHQKRFEETDLYLDKFSYLLRKTLDFSGLQKITLQEELLYSQNYLELEKLRLGKSLLFKIETDAQIDASKTLVPPMLLQPYLENAIKHGIRYLPTGELGQVNIFTKKENELVIISVIDNGVGIAEALQKKNMAQATHTSQGTALQQRRADLYNVQVNTYAATQGKGTVVQLTLQHENLK